jgi:hypothetical protein
MRHHDFELEFNAWLDTRQKGELSPRLKAHFAKCAQCAKYATDLLSLDQLLSSGEPFIAPEHENAGPANVRRGAGTHIPSPFALVMVTATACWGATLFVHPHMALIMNYLGTGMGVCVIGLRGYARGTTG